MAWTTSAIRRSTPVAARKPLPVRSAAKTSAMGMATSGRSRASSATSSPCQPKLPENAVVTRSPADSPARRAPPASPAKAPLATSAVPPTFTAETPERCAARGFSPSIRSRKPPTERDSHSATRTASTRATTTERLGLVAEEVQVAKGRVGRQRFTGVVLVDAGGPVEQQPGLGQAVGDELEGHEHEEQRRDDLGHLAPEAHPGGEPGPDRAADHPCGQRGQQGEPAGAGDADGDVRAARGADEQLPLLADVHQPGLGGDDGSDRNDQQGRGRRQREPPRAGRADAAVEQRGEDLLPRPTRRGDEQRAQREAMAIDTM